MAPRDMLPLHLPRDGARRRWRADAGAASLELPERGPEITEIQ